MNTYLILVIAIVFEVIGTSLLKLSDGFTKLYPTLGALACYAATFYCLSLLLRSIPMGVAYALWSGLGIMLITLIGLFAFGQKLDMAGYVGIGLIIAGVVVLNVLSNTTSH
ncbi:MAG: SMR family transporter [Pseudomonadota bacterium]